MAINQELADFSLALLKEMGMSAALPPLVTECSMR